MDESGAERKQNLEAKVIDFYTAIDQRNFEVLFDQCDDNIAYERDGLENNGQLKIEGIDAFKNFYSNERKLVGVHNTESLQNDGNRITVFGSLEGTYRGAPIKLRYKDNWVFNSQGKVTFRLTQIVRQS